MQQDEHLMLHLVIAGDKAAFESLYRRYIGRVYAVTLRLLANQAKADEAVQETFIRVWQQLPSFRGDSQFSTWLHRIAVGTAIDVWRQDKVARLVDDNSTDVPDDLQVTESHQLDRLIFRLPAQARAQFTVSGNRSNRSSLWRLAVAISAMATSHCSSAASARLLPR